MGKFRLRYRDRKVYLAVDKEWKPSEPLEETIARAVTHMNRTELSAAGVADAFIGDGGWKEWVVREPLMDWRTVKTTVGVNISQYGTVESVVSFTNGLIAGTASNFIPSQNSRASRRWQKLGAPWSQNSC